MQIDKATKAGKPGLKCDLPSPTVPSFRNNGIFNQHRQFWKMKRLAHLLLERADKLAYYKYRTLARQLGTDT